MALTIADYFYKQLNPEAPKIDLNACNMKVEKPLIAQEDGPQLFRVSGAYDGSAKRIDFSFFSVTSEGKKTITHATCGVKYESAKSWLAGWERSTFMVKSRIEKLLDGVHNGNNDLIKRGTAYKLFGGLINYGHKYRGMEEVVLDNAELEATSSVAFQTNGTDAKFYCSPYRIDSVAHLSGFVMLGNEKANPSKEVYVSHGWDNCRFARPLSMEKKYRSYVKMHQESAKVVVGDVYVFEGDSIVAVVEGLRVSPSIHLGCICVRRCPNVVFPPWLMTYSSMASHVNSWILCWRQQVEMKSHQNLLLLQCPIIQNRNPSPFPNLSLHKQLHSKKQPQAIV